MKGTGTTTLFCRLSSYVTQQRCSGRHQISLLRKRSFHAINPNPKPCARTVLLSMGPKLSVVFLRYLHILIDILICWNGLPQDQELNVDRAITKATYFHLYRYLFKLPMTARRESKPNEVVDWNTTTFTLECLHDCACT